MGIIKFIFFIRMKTFATLAIAATLEVKASKAPHEELLQVAQDSMQFYESDAVYAIKSGYDWQVVGDVKLRDVVMTFFRTGPAAEQVLSKLHAWEDSLKDSWGLTLNAADFSAHSDWQYQCTPTSKCCYGAPWMDSHNSKGRYCKYDTQSKCLNDSYGGVNYGCTWRGD